MSSLRHVQEVFVWDGREGDDWLSGGFLGVITIINLDVTWW